MGLMGGIFDILEGQIHVPHTVTNMNTSTNTQYMNKVCRATSTEAYILVTSLWTSLQSLSIRTLWTEVPVM